MSDWPTEHDFLQNLNTIFRLQGDTPKPIELKLVEVKGHQSEPREESGMERFSLLFNGPADVLLPQRTYPLVHDNMGELQIFLVPIGNDEQGFRYEAVFNFKTNTIREGRRDID